MSSSAIARSLCRISTPLTRAMTWSEADAAGVSCFDDESLEQPDTAGRTSASAVNVASETMRDRGARAGSKFREAIENVLGWGGCRRLDNRVGEPLAGDHLKGDFDQNKRFKPSEMAD